MEPRRRRGGLVGPLILIALGIVFLLNNLGYLNWDVWLVILRLWPLLLIAGGLDILIGRRSLLGSLIVVLLVLLMFGGAIWLMGTSFGLAGQQFTSQSINQPLQDATRAEVNISPGVARLNLGVQSEAATLIQGTVATSNDERVTQNFNVSGGTASYSLKSEGVPFFPFVGSSSLNRAWDLKLNPQVPTDLRVSGGVGAMDLTLLGMNLSSLNVSIGVGQTTITLPAQGKFQGEISGGIGGTVIRIPDGMVARIHLSTGIGSTDVPAGYTRQGETYVSPDYEAASNRADLNVSGAIGKITILLVKSP